MSYTKEQINGLIREMDQELKGHYNNEHHWLANKTKSDFQNVLISCIKFYALLENYKNDPTLFDLTILSEDQKFILLSNNYDTFSKYIDPTMLPNRYRVMLFMSYEKLYKIVDWDKVSKKDYDSISQVKPHCFVKYNMPFEKLRGSSWIILLNYDSGLIAEFVHNIGNIRNKTEFRSVLSAHPAIFNHLTVADMESSLLSAKEWLLFIKRTPGVNLSDEIKEWVNMEFHMEVLSGESEVTSYTKKAREENDGDGDIYTKI